MSQWQTKHKAMCSHPAPSPPCSPPWREARGFDLACSQLLPYFRSPHPSFLDQLATATQLHPAAASAKRWEMKHVDKEISAPQVSCTLSLSAQKPSLAPLWRESQAEATKACTALSVPHQQVRRLTLPPFTLTLAAGCRL